MPDEVPEFDAPVFKRLARNDTGSARGHQGGILVPRDFSAGDPVENLFAAMDSKPRSAVTSELTLAELLAPSKQKGKMRFEERRLLYSDLLIWSGLIDLRPVSRTVLVATASLRREFKCKLPDAIHIMTAIDAGCRFLVTDDEELARLPMPLQRLRSDAEGVGLALEALRA